MLEGVHFFQIAYDTETSFIFSPITVFDNLHCFKCCAVSSSFVLYTVRICVLLITLISSKTYRHNIISPYHVCAQINAQDGDRAEGQRDVSDDEEEEGSDLGDVAGPGAETR